MTDRMMNTWPNGNRQAMTQSEHAIWNAQHYPGTRQLCDLCHEPTGRCEDDSLYMDDEPDVLLCESCYEIKLEALEEAGDE